jgi:hypothetical protein
MGTYYRIHLLLLKTKGIKCIYTKVTPARQRQADRCTRNSLTCHGIRAACSRWLRYNRLMCNPHPRLHRVSHRSQTKPPSAHHDSVHTVHANLTLSISMVLMASTVAGHLSSAPRVLRVGSSCSSLVLVMSCRSIDGLNTCCVVGWLRVLKLLRCLSRRNSFTSSLALGALFFSSVLLRL